MKKEYWFAIILSVGVLVIILSYSYFQRLQVIPEITSALAIYISVATAVYTAIAKPNPNKGKKQEIYGQLKKTMVKNISILKAMGHQIVSVGEWEDIQSDDRYHLVDEKLKTKLDDFLDRTKEYNSAFNKLEFKILPAITQEVANKVFQKDPTTAGTVHGYVRLFMKRGEPRSISFQMYEHLKMNHSLQEIADYIIDEGFRREDVKTFQIFFEYFADTITKEEKVTEFWNECLRKLESIPEYKLMNEHKESLLEEAEEILPELIKRIENTINA
jgi:hypothetical protein